MPEEIDFKRRKTIWLLNSVVSEGHCPWAPWFMGHGVAEYPVEECDAGEPVTSQREQRSVN